MAFGKTPVCFDAVELAAVSWLLHGLKELRDEIDRLLGRVGSVTIVHEEWLLLCHLIREIVGEL